MPVPLVREKRFSQKPGLRTGCRSLHSTSVLERDPVLLALRHCPQPGPSGQDQGISRFGCSLGALTTAGCVPYQHLISSFGFLSSSQI
ncbi:hypothetical protein R6Z07F_009318 [Ovis aries]